MRSGERRRGPYFILEVLDRKAPAEPPRTGLTVTKKQGNSPERNRIRRRLKEAVRLSGRGDRVPHRPGGLGRDHQLIAALPRVAGAADGQRHAAS